MFLSVVQLCTFMVLVLLGLALNIMLDSTPVAFQSTPVLLHMAQNDPPRFLLGAFLIYTNRSTMIATAIQPVDNFTTDRTFNMIFNYTNPSKKDCVLVAWLDSDLAQSEPFSVTGSNATFASTISIIPSSHPSSVSGALSLGDPRVGNIPSTWAMTSNMGTPSSESTEFRSASSSIPPSPTSSNSGTALPGKSSTSRDLPTVAIVGTAVGSFALLALVFTLLIWRSRKNRRKSKESTPSRAFWRYLDMKGPPTMIPPLYTPRIFQIVRRARGLDGS
ncbi:uncharacterized protein EV420DRAFT_355369 [Desarmillaria tabescens]|uniref:Mid2 domain-containing protein n=1 Tax=Armillaria tabescens TaxID=1929756 RepID=A0AA39N520_ARMTA|nr:uncharacterized protein EV420DRAFT_355369 [Desarmillaria tabescens]KAK0458431.1 hypothetical protein EV420DRAFT_355369 [Desarmillaria tabescens]